MVLSRAFIVDPVVVINIYDGQYISCHIQPPRQLLWPLIADSTVLCFIIFSDMKALWIDVN